MSQTTISITIQSEVSLDEFQQLAKTKPIEAAEALGEELTRFDRWLEGRGMDPLSRYESQILLEYLGYKIVQRSPEQTVRLGKPE